MKDFKHAIFKKLVGLLFIVAMVLISIPQQAFAFPVYVHNPYSQSLSVATLSFEDNENAYYCHGWFNIPPYSTKTINIPDSTRSNAVWLYAYTSEATFGGEGYAGSVGRYVINSMFGYYNNTCPDGPNRRLVYFTKWEKDSNGVVDYTP